MSSKERQPLTIKTLENITTAYDDAYHKPNDIQRKYTLLSYFLNELFAKNDYLKNLDASTMNIMWTLVEEIDKHPILWKIVRFIFGTK